MMVQYLLDADAEVVIPGVAPRARRSRTSWRRSARARPGAAGHRADQRARRGRAEAAITRASSSCSGSSRSRSRRSPRCPTSCAWSSAEGRPDGGREFMAREFGCERATTRRRRTPRARGELLGRAAEASAPAWEAMLGHPFVRGIGDGRCPRSASGSTSARTSSSSPTTAACWRWGPRARRASSGCRFAALAESVLETEMDLHRQFAARWGVTAEQLESARTARHRRLHELPASHGEARRLPGVVARAPALHVELCGDRVATRRRRPARPRGLRRVDQDVRLGRVRAAGDLVPGAGRRRRRRGRGTRPPAHARCVPGVHRARDRVLGERRRAEEG